MRIITIIGLIIVFLCHAYFMWKMGRDFKKQLLINKELEIAKSNLKQGFHLNEKWYKLKKRSNIRRKVYIVISMMILIILIAAGFKMDLRLHYIGLLVALVLGPAFMGYEGIIPLPSVTIND